MLDNTASEMVDELVDELKDVPEIINSGSGGSASGLQPIEEGDDDRPSERDEAHSYSLLVTPPWQAKHPPD